MKSSQHEAGPGKVDHHTPSAHWCVGCWHWVVDCHHLVNPLPIEHRTVDDAWIGSLSYDRVPGRFGNRFQMDLEQKGRLQSVRQTIERG